MNFQKSTLPLIFLFPLLVVLMLLSALHTPTNAAPDGTITVNTLADDESDGCGTNNCTLREAITDAAAGDVINFNISGTIDISDNGQLLITKSLTINGSNVITVSGGNTTRVFAATNGNITFDSLVIAYGNDQGTSCYGSACGGGILVAIPSNGVVSVINSTIFSNTTSGNGGGIYNMESKLIVDNSTIMNNLATNGGGIYSSNWGSGHNVAVNNSTFSENTAEDYGGGLYNSSSGMDSNLSSVKNSTLSGNIATAGGGIDNHGRLYLSNTIVANTPSGSDCRSSGTPSGDGNLIEVNDNCGTPVSTDDPLLGLLQDNGGSTLIFELLTGSPAIDAGDNANCLPFDQRGIERPQDGDNDGTGTCDIGAYEVEHICDVPYVVTNTNSSGVGSLRQTIADVCLGGTIIFDNSLSGSTIDISVGSPITGQLTISRSLTISGNVPITISGGNASRVFKITHGNITLDGLTIANGNDQSADCYGDSSCGGGVSIQGSDVVITISNSTLIGNSSARGGGIYNDASALTVNNSIISGNSSLTITVGGGGIYNYGGSIILNNSTVSNNSTSFLGGGIKNRGGMMTINNSIILSNTASAHGGGIYNDGTISINNSSISNNSVNGFGGGINNTSGVVTINNSTISGNSADTVGGGIYNGGEYYAEMIVNNSTISGNYGGYSGGGIFNEDGLVNINSSTVTSNRIDGFGGGILSDGGNTTITNTIVSGNIVSDTAAANDLAYSGFSSGGYNLIGTMEAEVTAFIDGVNGDQTDVNNPELAPLANNGGDTFTHTLQSGSPAIDMGAYCGATDQRGITRPQDGDGNGSFICDIGAFEVNIVFTEFIFLPVVIK